MKDQSGSPKISVLIPAYNYGHYLQETIASVESQSYPDWEIILVDDCSTDNTFEIARTYQEKLKDKFVYIRNAINAGVSKSRNSALNVARGEYIAFLGADDRWHPAKLEKQLAMFEADGSTVDIIHTGVEPFADSEAVKFLESGQSAIKSIDFWAHMWNREFLKLQAKYKSNYFDIFRLGNFTCFSSYIMRRRVLSILGGFDETLGYQAEDWLLLLNSSLLFKFKFLPECLTYYRIHPQSYTARTFLNFFKDGEILQGQVYDRCLIFARRNGLKLSYNQLRRKPLLKLLAKKGKFLARLACDILNSCAQAFSLSGRSLDQAVVPAKQETCLSELDQLIFFVTSGCNLSCNACFYAEKLNMKNDISFEQIKTVAGSLKQSGTIVLTGGEPFLREDLGTIIRLFLRRCQVSVNTNGFFTQRIKEVVSSVLSEHLPNRLYIYVSIDGFQETHNKMRGNGQSYQKALDTLRILSDLRKKYAKLTIAVTTLISPDNLDEIVDFASELSEGFDFDYHNFEIERANPDTDSFFKVGHDRLAEVYKKLLKISYKRNPYNYYADRARFRAQFETAVYNEAWPFPCLAGKKAAVIYPDGMLSACEMRAKKINLADFNYDLSVALKSEGMLKEIDGIHAYRCFCTHGCWLGISMYNHYIKKYRFKNYPLILMKEGLNNMLNEMFTGSRQTSSRDRL